MNKRELANSPVDQSVREQKEHPVVIASGLGATEPGVKVFDELTGEDISTVDGVLTGTATIEGQVFTTPQIQVPTAGRAYRVECWFKVGDDQWIEYFRIVAKT